MYDNISFRTPSRCVRAVGIDAGDRPSSGAMIHGQRNVSDVPRSYGYGRATLAGHNVPLPWGLIVESSFNLNLRTRLTPATPQLLEIYRLKLAPDSFTQACSHEQATRAARPTNNRRM